MELDDTIAALASAAGRGERGIIRLSGPAVRETLSGIFDPDHPRRWAESRGAHRHTGRLVLRDFRTPVSSAVLLWPTSRSYTGQPAAELHLAGSPPLLEAVLSEVFARGIRPSRPGEFTLRAFLSGRIDLVQAEAVLGVIDAHDDLQLESALRQLAGGISSQIAIVRNDLLNLLADLEAGLDFVEDDIEFISSAELLSRIETAGESIAGLLERASARMLSDGRRRVVIAGLPNAGKSTLFNALIQRDAALVSDKRGTTRDYLTADCDWNGTAVELIDTAGWNRLEDSLASQAQQLRAEQLLRADLVLWCTPADIDAQECEIDARLRDESTAGRPLLLRVQTKSDVCATEDSVVDVKVSALEGTGLRELIARAAGELSGALANDGELLGTTAARCRESLESAAGSLSRAAAGVSAAAGNEIVAIDLHEALDHLGRILGKVYTDDILDRIFSRFCIGK